MGLEWAGYEYDGGAMGIWWGSWQLEMLRCGDWKIRVIAWVDGMDRWNGGGGCGVELGMGIPHTWGYGFRISEVMEMSDWWFWEWVDGFWVTGYGSCPSDIGW